MDEANLEKTVKRREDSQRRERLMKLLALIELGEFDSEKIPEELLYYTGERPREVYISPRDRDNYNSGYMEIRDLMVDSPNVR